MQCSVTAATKRDQVTTRFTTEALVGAVVKIVAERPPPTADETAGSGAVPADPFGRPALPARKPLPAGHVGAVDSAAPKTTHRPLGSGPGITHGLANSVRQHLGLSLRLLRGPVVSDGRRDEQSTGAA
jgi:hypothetical protein